MLYPYSYANYSPYMAYPSPYPYAGVSVPMAHALYASPMPTPVLALPPSASFEIPALTSPTPMTLPASRPRMDFKPPREPKHLHFPHLASPHKRDLLEETGMRYFGFTDEIGESWHGVIHHYVPKLKKWLKQVGGPQKGGMAHTLRNWVPSGEAIYNWSYRITGIYAAVDAVNKGYKAYQYHQDSPLQVRWISAFAQTTKTGMFQFLASYMAPLIIVKNFRTVVEKVLARIPARNPILPKGGLGRLYLPAVLCTALLPVISEPIDKAVHVGLDWLFTKLGLHDYATFRNDADGSESPE